MSTPGFFELYPAARPALPAGAYTATSDQALTAHTPHDGAVTVPVDDTEFHLDVVAPRYVMPPDQILSTFPPATSEGDWRERLPQIVLKRRTLPWERNPTFDPQERPEDAPPWLALVVLADGEGRLSTDVDTAQCVSSGVDLGDEADVPRGRYLEVTQDVVEKVFPCRDELELLCHVRKVDLADTELALGDDDGYLAVVLSNRLPQPATPGTPDAPATPLKYTAYLINLEHQLDTLLPTEPDPVHFFDALDTTQYVNAAFLEPAPNASLDQIAMGIGAGAPLFAQGKTAGRAKRTPAKGVLPTSASTEIVPYGPALGLEQAAASWATGPARTGPTRAADLSVASGYKAGLNEGILINLSPVYRYPVLVSWGFTCTGDGGFERLMNDLEVGLLGTIEDPDALTTPIEVAPTGHIALAHRTRQGEANTAWFRGPLTPQPTVRTEPVDGVLPLANTGDQLRKVVPDGREDLSQAALFEIGRLLTLNKPSLVSSLMAWRADLFGAARAREIADALAAAVLSDIGVSAAGQRDSIEHLVRTQLVGVLTALAPDALAPAARDVTPARVPDELIDLSPDEVLVGLGANPAVVARSGKTYGVDGLGAVPVPVGQATTAPVARDKLALAALSQKLGERVDELVMSALKAELPEDGARPKRSRRRDDLDRLITAAETEGWPLMELTSQAYLATINDAVRSMLITVAQLPTDGGVQDGIAPDGVVPADILRALARLRLLEGVPFTYLVPDAELIPPETIRFFYVDRNATDALVQGALSVGTVNSVDRVELAQLHPIVRDEVDQAERLVRMKDSDAPAVDAAGRPIGAAGPITGFLLRSRLVSGWPGLHVRAYATDTRPDDRTLPDMDTSPDRVRLLRMERLSPAVLLVLFDGVPAVVHLEEPRSGIQFGVRLDESAPHSAQTAVVTMRDVTAPNKGPLKVGGKPRTVPVPFRPGSPGVINMKALNKSLVDVTATNMGPDIDSAEYAMQMLRFPLRQVFGDPSKASQDPDTVDRFAPTIAFAVLDERFTLAAEVLS